MKNLSANKAAQVAHKTKQTILDAIKDGTLTATKNDRGHWQIDPSELNRVFPYQIEDQSGYQSSRPTKTEDKTSNTSVLQVELNAERDMRARLEAEIDDLKVQRDEWMNQAKQLALPKPIDENMPAQAAEKRRGVLARIFGG